MVDIKKFSEADLYGLLEVEITANEAEVIIKEDEFYNLKKFTIFKILDSQSLPSKSTFLPS
jgi:hypothetical protein